MIKRIKLFVNKNEKSEKVATVLKEKLEKKGFLLDEEEFDLGIAIGGDGAFLRMIKDSNFNSNCYYIGVHSGTLGFAQEVSINKIDHMIESLESHNFKEEEIGIQEIKIESNGKLYSYNSLNEIVIRDKELNTTHLSVFVDDSLLERYVGDGLLIATSFGSTAYNLSFGGSIVYNTFHTLQITPIAPLNSKSYRNLLNSVVIPGSMRVRIFPKKEKQDITITIDGDNHTYQNVTSIESIIDKKVIRVIRMNDYNLIERINDKFLK